MTNMKDLALRIEEEVRHFADHLHPEALTLDELTEVRNYLRRTQFALDGVLNDTYVARAKLLPSRTPDRFSYKRR